MEVAWMCVFTFFTVFQTNMAYRPEDWKETISILNEALFISF